MNSSPTRPVDPPESDEVEVSLFGPGFGESVLVHLGHGEWLSVDSCLDPHTNTPAALQYLRNLSIDPGSAVKSVVATHWDNDHIKGLAEFFRRCDEAKFHCTGALGDKDFRTLLGAWFEDGLIHEYGLEELNQIFGELKRRRKNRYVMPEFAAANHIIWERWEGMACEVRALSPSSSGIFATVAALRKSRDRPEQIRRRLPRISANHASVVLRLRIGDIAVLLGGDLQVRADDSFGWRVILREYKSGFTSDAYKVPHHGSENADMDEIWKYMLRPEPPALIAPFVGGRTRLPTLNDCRRIVARTSQAYITAPPIPPKYRDPIRFVYRAINDATRSVRNLSARFGHVRIRKKLNSPGGWRVETFGDAIPLSACIGRLEAMRTG